MIFDFAAFDRCDLPRTASLRIVGDQPGRLVVGPDEKNGKAGRMAGLIGGVITSSRSHVATRWGVTARIMLRKNSN